MGCYDLSLSVRLKQIAAPAYGGINAVRSIMPPFPAFTVAALPRILFGPGRIAELPAELAKLGRRVLVVTGGRSFREGPHWPALTHGLTEAGIAVETLGIDGEPSPEMVDEAVARFSGAGIDMVAGIGGGSAMDAAKAIAGLLATGRSVMDFLEGVGRGLAYDGPALPLVLVPTTAGTGSEATKNAVLSRGGPDGFKKSFRDDRLMPRLALIDPDLLATCPRPVMAANAMDALTQCLESYVSTRSGPLTDALALSGIEAVRDGLWPALAGEGEGRARLAYAALVSGICLAQTGLGAVHGLAAPLGAAFAVPHGVACGTLLAAATEVNIEALMERDPLGPAVPKYGKVGAVLGGQAPVCGGDGLDFLADILGDWTRRLEMPRLSVYGMTADDIPAIVAASGGNSMKTNPLVLTPEELSAILTARL